VKHTIPRKRFSTASRVDKIKRSALYKKGQYRLWIRGRKIQGPVKLLGVTYLGNCEEASGDEHVWQCELMFRDEVRTIGEYDLGVEVNEMEVLAWAAV
jgi:hypothetical protein